MYEKEHHCQSDSWKEVRRRSQHDGNIVSITYLYCVCLCLTVLCRYKQDYKVSRDVPGNTFKGS